MPADDNSLVISVVCSGLKQTLGRLPVASGVLAAVSGGADSLVMLHGLARVCPGLGVRLEVGTVDHGLSAEGAAWAGAVEAAAGALGLRCHRAALGLEAGPGLEARARRARYEALHAMREASGLGVVATAHTATDQAETLLMRLARGASLGGAAGVLEVRDDGVIRPLLFATRADVEACARALELRPAFDPMNADASLFRTRVRHDALPALSRAAGYDVAVALARFARLAAEDSALLDAEAAVASRGCRLGDGALDAKALLALAAPLRRRVLAGLLAEAGVPFDAADIEGALAAVARGSRATLQLDRVLECGGGRVRIEPAPPRRATRL